MALDAYVAEVAAYYLGTQDSYLIFITRNLLGRKRPLALRMGKRTDRTWERKIWG